MPGARSVQGPSSQGQGKRDRNSYVRRFLSDLRVICPVIVLLLAGVSARLVVYHTFGLFGSDEWQSAERGPSYQHSRLEHSL